MTSDALLTLPVLLITGPSGAGRSTAINALEDQGFEVIDNLPLSLLPRVLDGPHRQPLALGLDVRNRDFSIGALLEAIEGMEASVGDAVQLVYLDANDDVLLRRYSETRRRHPLAPTGRPLDGIAAEKDLLQPIRDKAEVLIDTTGLSPHDLKAEMERLFGRPDGQMLSVSVQSFSYKRGLPRGLDMVLDCRFLKNPHWDADLRHLTGQDANVAAYVATDEGLEDFFKKTTELLKLVLPAHAKEGRAHFSVGFGCTGGQHRSVVLTEKVVSALAKEGWQVSKRHRELERRSHES
ncbi:RNase adapter RapZ [Cognatiyoonia sp.]|uniref:RNase adapter RapZ n=1 Tax=Cognatiyoonia sp. TaxID=2211652 RepID=UPI003F696859